MELETSLKKNWEKAKEKLRTKEAPKEPIVQKPVENAPSNLAKNRIQSKDFIESVLKTTLPDDIDDSLVDGVVLCKLIEVGFETKMSKIYTGKIRSKTLGNIKQFLQECSKLNVPSSSIFQPEDLRDKKDMNKVYECILALQRIYKAKPQKPSQSETPPDQNPQQTEPTTPRSPKSPKQSEQSDNKSQKQPDVKSQKQSETKSQKQSDAKPKQKPEKKGGETKQESKQGMSETPGESQSEQPKAFEPIPLPEFTPEAVKQYQKETQEKKDDVKLESPKRKNDGKEVRQSGSQSKSELENREKRSKTEGELAKNSKSGQGTAPKKTQPSDVTNSSETSSNSSETKSNSSSGSPPKSRSQGKANKKKAGTSDQKSDQKEVKLEPKPKQVQVQNADKIFMSPERISEPRVETAEERMARLNEIEPKPMIIPPPEDPIEVEVVPKTQQRFVYDKERAQPKTGEVEKRPVESNSRLKDSPSSQKRISPSEIRSEGATKAEQQPPTKGQEEVYECELVWQTNEDVQGPIYVVGSFTNWEGAVEMELKPREIAEGKYRNVFVAHMKLHPGEYQYKFLVDKKWEHSMDHPIVFDGVFVNNYIQVFSKEQSKSRKRVVFTWKENGQDLRDIYVIGSFSHWWAKFPMTFVSEKDGERTYMTELLIEPGDHQYKFIRNGEWVLSSEIPVVGDCGNHQLKVE